MKKAHILLLLALVVVACNTEETTTPNKSLSVYPNPARGNATIVVANQNSPFAVKVFNAEGKIILNETSTGQQTEYRLTLNTKGTYRVILTINGKEIKQNVISL